MVSNAVLYAREKTEDCNASTTEKHFMESVNGKKKKLVCSGTWEKQQSSSEVDDLHRGCQKHTP